MSSFGRAVDIDVADAFEMREDRHARFALHARDEALAAARHDDVEIAGKALQHLADGGAVGRSARAGSHRPAGRPPSALRPGRHGWRADELSESEPPRRITGIAGLEAERAGIGRHVGPALIDDADDAERRAHALDVQAVRAGPIRRSPRRPDRARSAIARMPSAMSRMRSGVSFSRSMKARRGRLPRRSSGRSHWPRGSRLSPRRMASAMATSAAFLRSARGDGQRPRGGARLAADLGHQRGRILVRRLMPASAWLILPRLPRSRVARARSSPDRRDGPSPSAACIAEHRLDLGGLQPGDPYGIGGVIGNQPARDLAPVRAEDRHRVAAREAAADAP